MDHTTLSLITIPLFTGRDRLRHQLERRLDAVLAGRASRAAACPGLAPLADVLPRKLQQIPGVMHGGVGWQGIIPSRAAKMGSDRGRQGDREARQPGGVLPSSSSPRRSPSTILATARGDIRDARRADHGARAPAALARPAAARARGASHARVQEQLPEIVRDDHRRDRRATSTSCSTSS